MKVYYNEFDRKKAAWLRELMKNGLIAKGDVDERSIVEVSPDELVGYDRVHLFAGIGGWEYALRLAEWPDEWPIWTGSCPCQPYSCAGKGKGQQDERHLWPEMFRLVRGCRPDIVMGEQVEAAIRFGWLDGVCSDLEAEGYSCRAAVLGAHSVNAPQKRQRLYWMGESDRTRPLKRKQAVSPVGHRGSVESTVSFNKPMADGHNRGLAPGREAEWKDDFFELQGEALRMADRNSQGSQGWHRVQECSDQRSPWEAGMADIACDREGSYRRIPSQSVFQPMVDGLSDYMGVVRDSCGDKFEAVEEAVMGFPLSRSMPERRLLLTGAGDAIVPQVAAMFIRAHLDIAQDAKVFEGVLG